VRDPRIEVDAQDSLDSGGNPLAKITTTTYNIDGAVASVSGPAHTVTNTWERCDRKGSITDAGEAETRRASNAMPRISLTEQTTATLDSTPEEVCC